MTGFWSFGTLFSVTGFWSFGTLLSVIGFWSFSTCSALLSVVFIKLSSFFNFVSADDAFTVGSANTSIEFNSNVSTFFAKLDSPSFVMDSAELL